MVPRAAHLSLCWGWWVTSSGWRKAQWSLSLGYLDKAMRSEGSRRDLGPAHWLQHLLVSKQTPAGAENKLAPLFPSGDQSQDTFEVFKTKLDWAQSNLLWWKILFHGREVGIWWSFRPFPTWAILWFCGHFHWSTLWAAPLSFLIFPSWASLLNFRTPETCTGFTKQKQFKQKQCKTKCWVETFFFFWYPATNLKSLYPLCPADLASAPLVQKASQILIRSTMGTLPCLSLPAHNTSTGTHWHAGFPLLLLTQAFTIPLALLALSS